MPSKGRQFQSEQIQIRATGGRNRPAPGGTTGPYPSGGGMGMDGVGALLVGKFLKPPLTSARSPRDSSWILLISVSRFVWEGTVPSPSVVAGVCRAVHWAVTSITPRKRTSTRNYSAVTKLW